MKGYYWFLGIVFLLVWGWSAYEPAHYDDWLLENYLVFLGVPFMLITGYWFRLSALSYTLITLFLCLHVIGSHYTYSAVPFGDTLQVWLGADRNMYDRLVHFCFGLLLAYPVREVFLRLTRARGFWGYWLPVELTLAFSAVYELIEWGAAAIVNPEVGLAFLGSQGDVWDAQKDMALAGLGSIVTMLAVFSIHLRYRPGAVLREFVTSFRIPSGDAPLGEVALPKLTRKR